MSRTYVVDGSAIDVELAAERGSWALGEPVYVVFRVHNRGTRDLYTFQGGDTINALGRPDRFRIVVRDASGHPLADPLSARPGASGGNSFSGPVMIRHGETWERRLHVQDWGRIVAAGTHAITCEHGLVIGPDAHAVADLRPAPLAISLAVPIDIVDDADARGRRIDDYGRAAAVEALAAFDDPRVVPYLARIVDAGDYARSYIAVEALGRFADDRAFHALDRALHNADENIQAAAASALVHSPHAGGVELLWAERARLGEAARLTLTHACGERRDTARLGELARDPSPLVSGEAKRYLGRAP